MARYTVEKIFSFGDESESRAVVVDGSVDVSIWDGVSWVVADTLTTGPVEYFTKNLRLKFTPTGGASFFIDESGVL